MRRNILSWLIYRIFGERVGDMILGGFVAVLGVIAFFTAIAQGTNYWWFGIFLILLGSAVFLRQVFWPTTKKGASGAQQNFQQPGAPYGQQPYPQQMVQQQPYAPYPPQGAPYGQQPYAPYGQQPYPPQGAPHGQQPYPPQAGQQAYPPYGQQPYPPQPQPGAPYGQQPHYPDPYRR